MITCICSVCGGPKYSGRTQLRVLAAVQGARWPGQIVQDWALLPLLQNLLPGLTVC